MSKHTPGPWLIGRDGKSLRIEAVGRDEATGEPTDEPVCDDVRGEANARLIAAAPELLKAAIAALDFFNETRVGREWEEQGGTEPEELRTVIFKIEGRAE